MIVFLKFFIFAMILVDVCLCQLLSQCPNSNVGCLCRRKGTDPVCHKFGSVKTSLVRDSQNAFYVRSMPGMQNYCSFVDGKYKSNNLNACPDNSLSWLVVGFCFEPVTPSRPCCHNRFCKSCTNYTASCDLVVAPTGTSFTGGPTPKSTAMPTPLPTPQPTPIPTPTPTPIPTPIPTRSTLDTTTTTPTTVMGTTIATTITTNESSENSGKTPSTQPTDPFQITTRLSTSLTMTSITTNNNDNSVLIYALIGCGCVFLIVAIVIFGVVWFKKKSTNENENIVLSEEQPKYTAPPIQLTLDSEKTSTYEPVPVSQFE